MQGVRVLRLGMTYPLDTGIVRQFAGRSRGDPRDRGEAGVRRDVRARRRSTPLPNGLASSASATPAAASVPSTASSQPIACLPCWPAASRPALSSARMEARLAVLESAAASVTTRPWPASRSSAAAARTTDPPTFPKVGRRWRSRLPRHGAVDGSRCRQHLAHGRRGSPVDRPALASPTGAHVPEHRRRHVLPLRKPRDPRIGGGRSQRHVQVAVQPRRRDDGWAGRGRAHPVPELTTGLAAEGVSRIIVCATTPRSTAARRRLGARESTVWQRDRLDEAQRVLARHARRDGDRLRPAVRGREATRPQARRAGDADDADLHQRSRVRRLRRLRREEQLPVRATGGDRVRTARRRSISRRATSTTRASRATARRSSRSTSRQRRSASRPTVALRTSSSWNRRSDRGWTVRSRW